MNLQLKEKFSSFKTKVFGRVKEKPKNNSNKFKAFLSSLSRGLMLPIAILPIAGLFLGIGGAIGANVSTEGGIIAANIFKSISDVVFAILPLLFCVAITITFSNDKGSAAFSSVLAYLVFCSSQFPFIQMNGNGEAISILWFHKNIKGITATFLGFSVIQTSIFGGIVVGLLTSLIYNKVSKIKLPTALDFFSGIRLVPIVLLPTMFVLSLLFLIFWPWIGLGINSLGGWIQSAPYGTGGLLYGILSRALMPFGLHHIPIVLAYQTSFGGSLNLEQLTTQLSSAGIDQTIINNITTAFKTLSGGGSIIEGDQKIWNFINSLPYNTLLSDGTQIPIFHWFYKHLNVYAGRYTQDYPTYIGVNVAIGLAMIVVAEKKNRRDVSAIVGSAMLVAFLTGITEPLEYSFLFCAPLLYYLIYVPLSGFSYMFMELLGAHVGVGFARGFIDLIIYGALPVVKGTKFYWAFLLAAIEGGFAFFLFWFFIKKFNISTPGRNDNIVKLISKAQYNEMKSNKENKDQRTIDIIKYLGGTKNIVNVSACATRLRVTVNSSENLLKSNFVQTGSKGEVIKDNYVQIIYGGEATILADKINELIHSSLVIDPNFDNKENNEIKNDLLIKKDFKKINVYAPFDGKIMYLENVPDDVFKEKILGDGLAIIPKTKNVFSPVSGQLENVFETKHCYTFKIHDINVMMHIGIDSINNAKNIFKNSTIKENEKVTKNTKLVEINLSELKKVKSLATPIVVPSSKELDLKITYKVKDKQVVKKGDILFTIE